MQVKRLFYEVEKRYVYVLKCLKAIFIIKANIN